MPTPKLPLYGNLIASNSCRTSRACSPEGLGMQGTRPDRLHRHLEAALADRELPTRHELAMARSSASNMFRGACPGVEKRYKSPGAQATKDSQRHAATICGITPQPAGSCLIICSLLCRTVGEKECTTGKLTPSATAQASFVRRRQHSCDYSRTQVCWLCGRLTRKPVRTWESGLP